ncbi:MAG: DsbA family protein [Thermoanaerobaculia bacterium]
MGFQDKNRASRIGWIAVLAVVAAAAVWVASETASAEDEPASAGKGHSEDVLARVGDIEISLAEVEAGVAKELRDLDRQRYDLIERGLDTAISEALIEIAAKAGAVGREEFLQKEVYGKVAEVTDSEVDVFYEARKGQIQQPKEAVAGQIRQYLAQTRQQEAYGALVAGLRSQHEPEVFLEPMRIEVAAGGAPAKGPESAPVTIVEFSDFQCPFCSRVIPTLNQVTEKYGDRVRLVFRQFPLHSIHPQAQKAAEAALCADEQGKFWEMHDAMFADQSKLQVADLKSTAAGLGVDGTSFDECLDTGRHADRVNQDLQAGVEAGVTGTPAMFINGRFLSGAQPFDAIAKVIDDELRRAGG